jgi:hypothetical protein
VSSLVEPPVLAACFAAFASFLSGCAIYQKVTPVERFEEKQVCIIENAAVRVGFIEAYKRALIDKGYAVKQLPTASAITECTITSTYTANWQWDLALYMAYAEIKVFKDGKPIGEAKYDARGGAGNPDKFIAAEKKIAELVNLLFPGGPGS